MRELRLRTAADALAELDRVTAAPPAVPGPWTLAQILAHCAQSVEYSMDGYPTARSALFRGTVGRLAMRTFLRRGHMSHDVAAGIPGAPDIGADVALADARARLRAAFERFVAFEGELAPHFAYGKVTKPEYEALHAMHLADHLCRLPSAR